MSAGAPPCDAASSTDGDVRIERRGDVAWMVLDRPPLNLFTLPLIHRLRAAVDAVRAEPGVRALVITGAGRAMTGGMQVQVLRGLDPGSAKALISALHEAIQAVHEAPFPTVAMINGACLGAGFELAMACDLRVASTEARLGLPEVRVGIPSVIEAALLPALVGPGRAAELLLTGEAVTADQALAWGLVNRVATPAALESVATGLVEAITACAPSAIRLQKELIIRWRNTDLATAIAYGINAFAQSMTSDDAREAMQAFLDKRPPRFRTERGAGRS
ncbi:MAG: enoyl-CoA hydratase-related protein [Candidatus Rokubacteria bacterium]|nr:enoyl-CoA hydratase-related protein [Candidatus Rokubacteria bacterium]